MSKATLIRKMKLDDPTLTSHDIAEEIGVSRAYVSHILWRSKEPSKTKQDYVKDIAEQKAMHESLREEIKKLKEEIETLKIVNKFLREN